MTVRTGSWKAVIPANAGIQLPCGILKCWIPASAGMTSIMGSSKPSPRPSGEITKIVVIPANAGLRRQDAGANVRAANGPKGTRQESRVIQLLAVILWQRLNSV
jgi:hypothetical protein